MSTQEFYIRNASETDARGPFNLEQMVSLAETRQLDLETLYYDANTEAWTPIANNPDLVAQLFPARRLLKVKAKSDAQVKPLNAMSESDRPITVNDMLLAAEGRTEDTKHHADPGIVQSRAAAVGLFGSLAILLITALAYILPSIDVVLGLQFAALLHQPLPILGFLNLILAICLGLGAIGAYPMVRFAAMLGLGYTGVIFYLDNQPLALGFAAVSSVGLFLGTLLVNLPGNILCALLGLIGACGVFQVFWTS
jgi:hypothetical protein